MSSWPCLSLTSTLIRRSLIQGILSHLNIPPICHATRLLRNKRLPRNQTSPPSTTFSSLSSSSTLSSAHLSPTSPSIRPYGHYPSSQVISSTSDPDLLPLPSLSKSLSNKLDSIKISSASGQLWDSQWAMQSPWLELDTLRLKQAIHLYGLNWEEIQSTHFPDVKF